MTTRISVIEVFLVFTWISGSLEAASLTGNNLPEDTNSTKRNDTREAKVLILGAGIAGITAGETLTDKGITDFIILEGSDRIGGRIKSVKFGGKTIEVGAAWILLQDDTNPLWKAIKKYNISGSPMDSDRVVIRDENGNDVTDTEGTESWDRLEEAEKKMEELYKRMKKDKTDMSIRSCLDVGGWQGKSPVDDIVEIFEYDLEYGNIPGMDSCRSHAYLKHYAAAAYYVSDIMGLESVVQQMADAFLKANDSRLVMNEIVHTINYTSDGVAVQTNSGKIYKADYALFTFSLAVLKKGSITINPPLPNWKIDNLFRIRMESYSKIFLKFPSNSIQFWDSSIFTLHANSRRGYFPVFIYHNADQMPQKGTNILQIISMGVEADRLSTMKKSDIIVEVMAMLKKVYPNHTITDPEEVYISRWEMDPLYLSAFANIEPGVSQEQLVAIRAPVDRLYFAGEAFSDFDGYSTGAAISADDNAKKMAACIQGKDCYKYNPNEETPQTQSVTCGGGQICLSNIPLMVFFVVMIKYKVVWVK